MSSRKRPLAELGQPQSTPARYAPSTPHAIRAIQQRSGVKTRSARSVRHASADVVRPDSIRGVLRQFAKIAAPITKKRAVTPSSVYNDKENRGPNHQLDEDNDSILVDRPDFNFAISESIEEDDSEILVAPTPSVLPGEDDEQPTATFPNISRIPILRPTSERSDRRRSAYSFQRSEPIYADEEDDQDGDVTIMTERGRRAMSEEATGRFSRYSFGSIRMSGFGSELEFHRDSLQNAKTLEVDLDEYVPLGGEESFNGGDTDNIRHLRRSESTDVEDGSVHLSMVDNETFALDLLDDERAQEDSHVAQPDTEDPSQVVSTAAATHPQTGDAEHATARVEDASETSSRRQTLLEAATTKSQAARKKRVKLTRHGTEVPALPASLARRIVLDSYEMQAKRKPKLGKDHIKALEQATEWFFEQVGEDLATYSSHGRRKKRVDAGDVLLLMRRQKVCPDDGDFGKLAKAWLPKEDVSELDVPDRI